MELTKKQLIKLVQFATGKIHSSFTWEDEAEDTVDEYLKAINYTHCCETLNKDNYEHILTFKNGKLTSDKFIKIE